MKYGVVEVRVGNGVVGDEKSVDEATCEDKEDGKRGEEARDDGEDDRLETGAEKKP